jgi:hypothetical protein
MWSHETIQNIGQTIGKIQQSVLEEKTEQKREV